MIKRLMKSTALLWLITASALSYADTIWIDVRTEAEHHIDHIDGDMRITHTQIVSGVEQHFPDRESDIHLYCRSGNRAGKAKAALEEAGYRNISNAGSIDDARQQRGLSSD
ncbi:conserved hypothetical protein [gamma proteobacterium HTCC5015]|nr:conserved hypothetical protein [gamma proteobacterium HTCC5015]